MLKKKRKSYFITKENKYNMNYEDFILDIIRGHEFIGYINNEIFKILNLYEDYYTIRVGENKFNISRDEDIEDIYIYNDMTLKDLIDKNMLRITESY